MTNKLAVNGRPATVRVAPATGGGMPSAGLWDRLRMLVRHRWWALAGFVLLAPPMAAITLMTTPVYRSTATLLLSEEAQPRVGLIAPESGPATPSLDPKTQIEVVRSRALARDVVAALELWQHPLFAPAVAGESDPGRRNDMLIDPFLGMLSVAIVPESRVLAVSVESPDPALAARAANAVADRYINRDRESRFAAAESSAEWLSKRLAEQREQVSRAETALQSYRASRDALSLSDRQNIVGQKPIDLNTAVTKAKTDRILRDAGPGRSRRSGATRRRWRRIRWWPRTRSCRR